MFFVTATQELTGLVKALADPTRLRLLGALACEELSVGELCRVVGMAQSRVSNHLRILREHAFLAERHVGSSTYLRPALLLTEGDEVAARLWTTLREELSNSAEHEADLHRLRALLAERERETEFFDRVAVDWDKIGVDFQSGQARQRVLANLLPPGLVIADLGCGTGYFGRALLGLSSHLICVDASAGMLEEAQKRLSPTPPGTRVEMRQGELDALPIEDGELDACVAGMVMHHLAELSRPLAEMLRALAPGGTAVVLELAPHREDWMRDALGDRHLGLESSDVLAAFERAGFVDVRLEHVDDRYCPTPPPSIHETAQPERGLELFLVRGRKPR